MKHLSIRITNQIKYLLFIACLIPFANLLLAYLTNSFGPNPVADITHTTGIWALNLLIASLAISPVRKLTHWNWLIRLRRTIALYAFFYASLHILNYLLFDQFFDWPEITKDISRYPYMMVGLISFVLMIPLALTSTTAMMKLMGGRYWQMLHRLAYPVVAAAVVHYFWLVKQDITKPSVYAIVLLSLFFARLTKTRQPLPNTLRIKSPKAIES